MPSCPSSVVVVCRPSSSSSSTFHLKSLFLRNCLITFLLLWHGAFIRKVPMYCKNVDLVESSQRSILKVRKVKFGPFSTWRQFSQKLFDNFFSILSFSQWGCWWTATRWIWLNHSKCHFSRSERSKKVKFGCFATFFKNGWKTVLYFVVHSFLGMLLINCKEMDFIKLFKRSFSRSENVRFSPFSHNYWYYSVVTKCCPNLLYHVASLLWNQSGRKIWKVWNQFKRC